VKRIVLLGVLSLAIAMVPQSLASVNDVNGPACSDIVLQAPSGATSFGSYAPDGTVLVAVSLGAPKCTFIDYTVTVITVEGSQTLSFLQTNAAGDLLLFSGTVDPTTNSSVCVFATTSVGGGNHVFDRATDTGCVSIPKSGSPGFGGFD
jgi:hypothetical protein